MTTRTDEVAGYAAEVRAALAGIPAAERDELLDDLDDHLLEVAAESDSPLRDRLGAPREYAAELRAAYGTDGPGPGPRERMRALGTTIARTRAWHEVKDLLPELRVLWWALRGHLAAVVVMTISGSPVKLIPHDLDDLYLPAVGVLISIYIGKRTIQAGPGWCRLTMAGNAIVVGLVLYLVFSNPYYVRQLTEW
jgi:hypothetical protein